MAINTASDLVAQGSSVAATPGIVNTGTALTTATAANVAQLTLGPGLWLVFGEVVTVPAATTTTTVVTAGLSTTSATQPANAVTLTNSAASTAGTAFAVSTLPFVLNISVTTTIFLVATATFATSTMTGNGAILATPIVL